MSPREAHAEKRFARSPLIVYNLFPRLAGSFREWIPLLDSIQAMGFTWIYLNPFQRTGGSRSLYAVADWFCFDGLCAGTGVSPERGKLNHLRAEQSLRRFLEGARARGIEVMLDLVANHTATDSALVQLKPEWYRRTPKGTLLHPGTREGRRRVVWGDLAQLDLRKGPVSQEICAYFSEVCRYYLGLGFGGFRCDAAHKVPSHFWSGLISQVRALHPQTVFLGETLGCTEAQVLRIQRVGFDWVCNSFNWWNLQDPGFLQHYARLAPHVNSVAFPESHDTERCASRLKGNRRLILQRYALAAFFSAGVLMPMGFERGATKRLNVVQTSPTDLEPDVLNLGPDIAYLNQLKRSQPILQVDAPWQLLWSDNGLLAMQKRVGSQRLLLLALMKGPSRNIQVPAELLGPRARVLYGLRSLDAGALHADMVLGEVFVALIQE